MHVQDQEIFRDFLGKIIKRFQCSSGSIALYDGESENFKVVASKGLRLERLGEGIDTRKGVTSLIYQRKRIIFIDKQHPLPSHFNYRRERELCSICFPLIDSRKHVIGIVSINKRRGTFPNNQVIFLKLLIEEISALAGQIHCREEEEKITLTLQDGFTKLLQDSVLAPIEVMLQNITETSRDYAGARFAVLHAPLFTASPAFSPQKVIFSLPWWDKARNSSPHTSKGHGKTPLPSICKWNSGCTLFSRNISQPCRTTSLWKFTP
ncbi:MAG: GAF domain-containing protein [Atribacterota bacterium]